MATITEELATAGDTAFLPAHADVTDPVDAGLVDAGLVDAGLVDDSDELLVEEISIDGMCGVY